MKNVDVSSGEDHKSEIIMKKESVVSLIIKKKITKPRRNDERV